MLQYFEIIENNKIKKRRRKIRLFWYSVIQYDRHFNRQNLQTASYDQDQSQNR